MRRCGILQVGDDRRPQPTEPTAAAAPRRPSVVSSTRAAPPLRFRVGTSTPTCRGIRATIDARSSEGGRRRGYQPVLLTAGAQPMVPPAVVRRRRASTLIGELLEPLLQAFSSFSRHPSLGGGSATRQVHTGPRSFSRGARLGPFEVLPRGLLPSPWRGLGVTSSRGLVRIFAGAAGAPVRLGRLAAGPPFAASWRGRLAGLLRCRSTLQRVQRTCQGERGSASNPTSTAPARRLFPGC